MSDKAQNDWDVVADALAPTAVDALAALSRLREATAATIAGLTARIEELEAPEKSWPTPADLPPDYWESAQ